MKRQTFSLAGHVRTVEFENTDARVKTVTGGATVDEMVSNASLD